MEAYKPYPENPVDYMIETIGLVPLEKIFGLTYQAIYRWRKRVPAERVLQMEAVTGIPRHVIRPDLYPAHEYSLLLALRKPLLQPTRSAP